MSAGKDKPPVIGLSLMQRLHDRDPNRLGALLLKAADEIGRLIAEAEARDGKHNCGDSFRALADEWADSWDIADDAELLVCLYAGFRRDENEQCAQASDPK